MSVMKSNIEKKWPLFLPNIVLILVCLTPLFEDFLLMCLEKLADQKFNAGDVSPHLEDRVVLLCVGKVKWVDRSRTHMLFSNYTCGHEAGNNKRVKW